MNATQAREYLTVAVVTETGKQALRALGFGAVITAPGKGDDRSTIIVAECLRVKLRQSYGF